jgi:hypothetical protein
VTQPGLARSLTGLRFAPNLTFGSLRGNVVRRRVQLVALVAGVAVVALLPLYGDPRNSAVTHAEWARMLLRGLDMHDAMQQTSTAAQAFSVLSWKGSLSYRADRFLTGDDVRVEGAGEERRVVPTGEIGEVTYAVAVVKGGDYRLRVHMSGAPGRPVSAELARVGEVKPVDAFTLVPATAMTWVDAGASHLDPGAYTASVLLPRGTTLEHVEVAPPCVMPIEPPGGWNAPAVLLSEHAAVTMVQALDKLSELPPASVPVELEAAQFQTESGAIPVAFGTGNGLDTSVKGGTRGLRAVIVVDFPEPGLYTLSAFGLKGAGQSWTADSCLKSVVCADRDVQADIAEWRPVLTAQFAAGRHAFSVLLAPGAVIQRARVEMKKETPADYVAALRRIGFDVGPAGPMPRDRAVDAMRFLEKRATPMKETRCGDVVLPGVIQSQRTGLQVAQVPGPAQPGPNVGGGQPPLGSGPLVPVEGPTPPPVGGASPAPGASPSTPVTPPSASPAPSPAPSATAPPPPSPLPSPDDATPVQPLQAPPSPRL